MASLAKNTATTILIGPLYNWSDSKTLLYDALDGNDNFDPSDITITLFKGSVSQQLTLSKSGGTNNINLVAGGMATLELTAADTDTAGTLTIAIGNAVEGAEIVFCDSFGFTVAAAATYGDVLAAIPANIVRYYAAFDGLSGSVSVVDDDSLDAGTGDFGVAGWFDDFTDGQSLISKCDVSPFKGYRLYTGSAATGDAGYLICSFSDGIDAAIKLQWLKTGIAAGWHHVGAAIDRDGVGTLYVDREPVATATITSNRQTFSNSQPLLLGTYASAQYYGGSMDDIRIYNDTALSADEMASVHRGGQGTRLAGTPTPSWRCGFDTVDGTTIRGVKADGFELNATKNSGVTLVAGGVPFAATTPSGYFGKAMAAFKNLLAESTTLWDGLGLAGDDGDNTEAAKQSIYLSAYDVADQTIVRPFILVSRIGTDRAASTASGSVTTVNQSGSFEMRIEREIPAGYRTSAADAEQDFMNFADGVLDDMMALAGQPGYLILQGWEIIDGPFQFAQERSEEYVFGIRIKVSWGMA